jgi:hypothetical protein
MYVFMYVFIYLFTYLFMLYSFMNVGVHAYICMYTRMMY